MAHKKSKKKKATTGGSSVLLKGRLDIVKSGMGFVIVEGQDRDIIVRPDKMGTALDGDEVRVEIIGASKRNGRQEGAIREVVTRRQTEFSGTLDVHEHFAFLLPDKQNMPVDIFVPLDLLHVAKKGDQAIVRIKEWNEKARNPVGEVISILTNETANERAMQGILVENNFPLTFPDDVLEDAARYPEGIDSNEIKNRRDFRDTLTVTIDPVDAKDFDDAISFKTLENGHYEVGVHIADVSYYVKPNSSLDKEAYSRATSVYLVDRVIPMLPERLSNGVCSLRPNEDKLCFAAVFELDKEAHIVNQWFGKTIIHSDKRFTYEEAQELIENKTGTYSREMNILNDLAFKLRDRKFAEGAISFESSEVKFKLDPSGKPVGVYVKERKEAHKLIEDFMLLANRKVAEFIAKKGKGKQKMTFVYRSHDAPNELTLISFAQFAAKFGYKINTKSDREIARSLNHLMEDVEGKKEQNVLTQLAIRSMAKAVYTTKKSSHYGLAFDYYTHFTSPIRRYPDVLVHRLLELYLGGGKSVNEEDYEKMSLHSSQMEKKAADAERASIKYKQAEYLEDNIGKVYDGIISGVTEWGMYVEIIENKCEGMVRLREITDDFYVLDEKNYCIIGQRKKKKYQLGDEVKIRVKKVDLAKRQIDFSLVQE